MKYHVIVAFFIAASFAGCKTKCVEDSGKRGTKVDTVKVFDKIEAKGLIKIVLKQDSSYVVKVEADSNVVDIVKASVSGSKLKIELDSARYCGKDSVLVYVGVGSLKELSIAGNVNLVSSGRLNAEDIKLSLLENCTVSLDLNVAKLITKVDGIGHLWLSGQAGTHILTSKGTLDIKASDFVVGIYNLQTDGIGNGDINVLNELKVNTNGSSTIHYKGNPKKVDRKNTGNSVLEKVN